MDINTIEKELLILIDQLCNDGDNNNPYYMIDTDEVKTTTTVYDNDDHVLMKIEITK